MLKRARRKPWIGWPLGGAAALGANVGDQVLPWPNRLSMALGASVAALLALVTDPWV
jgi:hypothetical protein